MGAEHTYGYAITRVVPRVERGETDDPGAALERLLDTMVRRDGSDQEEAG